MRDLIGRTLGHYRIVDKIGEGGMGEVYRAHDERLDRDVAVKVLPASVAQDPERISRFEREAKAVAKLEHPNILAIYDFGTEERVSYSVTELLAGETLRERLEGGALGWRKAAEVGASISDGLAAAHGAGIIHRDLKPDNVFITSDGRVKILDFGLARDIAAAAPDETHSPTVSRYTDPGAVMGTAGYMSPEQVRGEPADARSDIFALGSVLYEMATGRRAFARDTAAETMTAILKEEPTDVSTSGAELPPELAGTIRRCLEKRPQARFQSASDLAFNLRSMSSDSAFPAVPRRRIGGWHRAALGVAVASTVVIALMWLNPGGWRSRLLGKDIPAATASIDSLVVLPFANMGGDEETEYLSEGIPASIIDRLSRVPTLRVVPRSTAFHFDGQDDDLRGIGRRLDVRAILTGQVRAQDETLIIRVELMDVLHDRQLWGERFTRTADDILETEVEIAKHVTDALRVELSGESLGLFGRGGTSNPIAHRHYLKGRYLIQEGRTGDSLRKAIESFREAIEEDPDFALAYCSIAETWLMLNDWDYEPLESAVTRAREAVEKALTLDDDLAEAHLFRAAVSEFDWDPVTARQEYLRALELDPQSVNARMWYAWSLAVQGNLDAAIAEIQTALQADPLSLRCVSAFIQFLLAARQYDRALKQIDYAVELDPSDDRFLTWRGRVLAAQGAYAEAVAEFEEIRKPQNGWLAYLGWIHGRAGRRVEALAVLSELERRAQLGPVSPVFPALIHVGLGDNDQAFLWLEKALSERSSHLAYLKFDPEWDPIRDDPRFDDLIARISYFVEE